MTKDANLQIPDPTFPEHQLIQDSAPIPELSAGFKARVMAECSVSMASAARAWRWKVGSSAAVVCALGLLVCLVLPGESETSAVIKQAESVPQPPERSHYQLPPSSASRMAADMPKPPKKKDSTSTPGRDLLDGLNQRRQMFEAHMGPTF